MLVALVRGEEHQTEDQTREHPECFGLKCRTGATVDLKSLCRKSFGPSTVPQ